MPSTAFNAAAETARYLGSLPPAVKASAKAYTQGGHWLLLWGVLAVLAACWVVARLGILTRLRGRLGRRVNLAALVCVAVFSLSRFVLTLPWSAYADWGRERAYGLSAQPFADWLVQGLIQAVISAFFLGLLFVGVYAMIRKAGRAWPLLATGLAGVFVAIGLVAAPAVLLPVFNTYQPAPAGPVREAVAALAREAGAPNARILVYDGSRQSNRFTANVTGLGPTAQVALSDAMFAQGARIDEVRAVVAHEIGHYRHHHLAWLALALTVVFAIGFWLIDRLYPLAARLLGLGVTPLSDPAGFPAVAALVAVLGLLITPVINTMQRGIELDADRFSLDVAQAPDGLAKALLKSADYRAPSPSALEEALFYDHPSIARRIGLAMDWKAANLPPATPPTASEGHEGVGGHGNF